MDSWREILNEATSRYKTPFYLISWPKVLAALEELAVLNGSLPIRHWFSFKTSPVAPLVRRWIALGLGVEVISEYELQAAIMEGCPPERILVNGVGKHGWLCRYPLPRLNVVFDSVKEMQTLAKQAVQNEWLVGLRIHVSNERDPDEVQYSTQFGMNPDELVESLKVASECGLRVELVHFHLRSNVHDSSDYWLAVNEVAELSHRIGIKPRIIDCGGGLPVSGERPVGDAGADHTFDLAGFADVLNQVSTLMPSVSEIWLENGRFLTARAGVLVVKVVDVKQRADSRFLICDGGRTNHALVSDWENHDVFVLPPRHGHSTFTTICGPTCMAYDRLVRGHFASDIQIEDYIVWKNAGAYHIPWETRFSGGLATVLWSEIDNKIVVARGSEPFDKWWGEWR